MEREQPSAGDYGYDLAHEVAGSAEARRGTQGHPDTRPPDSGSPVPGPDDASSDLSYDEAHGF